jgi:lantibiotic modifying enzyme
MGGSAGAALSLLALHRARPAERTLAAATAAGETLLKHARAHDEGLAWPSPLGGAQPLLGLSHGAAGPALALSRLAEATGDGRFAEAADRAVSYEHRRYVPEQRNWPDLREISPDGVFMHAWCHGAPGIGLARAELALRSGDPAIREDLRNAVDSVRDVLAPGGAYAGIGNHSLCHGDLGLIETLLTGGQALADQEVVGLARRAARTVADDVLAGRTRCGVPFGVEVPGLLTGIAGVGYGLLRAASPDDVPNVLLVEPPAR